MYTENGLFCFFLKKRRKNCTSIKKNSEIECGLYTQATCTRLKTCSRGFSTHIHQQQKKLTTSLNTVCSLNNFYPKKKDELYT